MNVFVAVGKLPPSATLFAHRPVFCNTLPRPRFLFRPPHLDFRPSFTLQTTLWLGGHSMIHVGKSSNTHAAGPIWFDKISFKIQQCPRSKRCMYCPLNLNPIPKCPEPILHSNGCPLKLQRKSTRQELAPDSHPGNHVNNPLSAKKGGGVVMHLRSIVDSTHTCLPPLLACLHSKQHGRGKAGEGNPQPPHV